MEKTNAGILFVQTAALKGTERGAAEVGNNSHEFSLNKRKVRERIPDKTSCGQNICLNGALVVTKRCASSWQ